jgi:hypothetical protein
VQSNYYPSVQLSRREAAIVNEPAVLLRAAGYAALTIIPLQIAAGLSLWLFFGGVGAVFGPINDLLVAISLALLALPILAIRSIAAEEVGPWFDLVTGLALLGLALGAIGQVLLVMGAIRLETSFVTGGLGILPVLAWAVALAVVAGRVGGLPDQLGWATLALLVMIAVAAVGSAVLPPPGVVAVSAVLLAALAGWLAVVGWTCLTAASPGPVGASA